MKRRAEDTRDVIPASKKPRQESHIVTERDNFFRLLAVETIQLILNYVDDDEMYTLLFVFSCNRSDITIFSQHQFFARRLRDYYGIDYAAKIPGFNMPGPVYHDKMLGLQGHARLIRRIIQSRDYLNDQERVVEKVKDFIRLSGISSSTLVKFILRGPKDHVWMEPEDLLDGYSALVLRSHPYFFQAVCLMGDLPSAKSLAPFQDRNHSEEFRIMLDRTMIILLSRKEQPVQGRIFNDFFKVCNWLIVDQQHNVLLRMPPQPQGGPAGASLPYIIGMFDEYVRSCRMNDDDVYNLLNSKNYSLKRREDGYFYTDDEKDSLHCFLFNTMRSAFCCRARSRDEIKVIDSSGNDDEFLYLLKYFDALAKLDWEPVEVPLEVQQDDLPNDSDDDIDSDEADRVTWVSGPPAMKH